MELPSFSQSRTRPSQPDGVVKPRGGSRLERTKQSEKLSSRGILLKKLALATLYKETLYKNKHKKRVMLPYSSISKRSRHTAASIEVLVVVDNSIYKEYLMKSRYSVHDAKQKIYKYYSLLFAMVNERYSTISDESFSIRVNICDIIIVETRRELGWLETISRWSATRGNSVLNASRALRRFQKWLRRAKFLPDYDHAVLFTSYILSKKKKQIDGLAYVGTMCQTSTGKSSSILQDAGDFQSAGVVAHELGHSLGVWHDGEGLSTACPASKNYVMAPQSWHDVRVASNVYHFSQCSVKQIKKFVTSTRAICLYNKPSVKYSYDMKQNPPGKVFDEDAQCQLSFGPSSRFCEQGTRRSDICSRLWCTSPNENEYTCRSSNRLMALPGTSCGYGQHCHLGRCISYLHMVYNSPLPLRDENCPMGDGNPAQCRKIVENSPYLCERSRIKDYCCESCDSSATKYFRKR